MRGNPKYIYGDIVKFKFNDTEKIGIVAIIDAYGTFADDSDVSYDLMVKDENTLYKHFREDFLIEKIGHTDIIW